MDIFNRFKSSAATPHNGFDRNIGNLNFDGAIISVRNKIAYRYDSRSPDIIKINGFSGTLSRDIEEVRVFGPNNVFSSRTKEGAKEFLTINKFVGQERIQHLYQIDTKGIETFSFMENYKQNPLALIESIANLAQNGALKNLPKDQIRLFARETINNQFCFVDELHINGPIPPSRIKHITTILAK
jgi:hypothetical protein